MSPAISRKAPYKDFLQPALHRRFSSAATVLLGLVYVQAIFLGELTSFLWSWFPIGPVGVRTALLFACALSVIVLRISQYHFGSRATASPIHSLPQLFTIQALEAWLFYGFSSALFGLVYLWSRPSDSKLNWVIAMSGDRVKLNERPVFVVYYLFVSAIAQTFVHMTFDKDQLRIDISEQRRKAPADSSHPLKVVLSRLPAIFVYATVQSLVVWVISVISYTLLFRRTVWGWSLAFSRPFYNLPKSNMLPPRDYWLGRIALQCLYAGVTLSTMWMVANYAFSKFMVKAPLKNGKPLTNDSKDPNGSLLNGLKSKKASIRCFAVWELALIARDFEDRRKAVFEDIDRKDGPMWSHIYVICLDIVKAMEARVDDYGKPAPAPAVEPEPVIEPRARSTASTAPLKEEPIFRGRPATKSMRGEVEKALTQAGRAPGQSPIAQLSPLAKKTLQGARDKVLSKEQQEALSPPQITSQLQAWALTVIRYPYVGWIFRQTFRRCITPAVFGTPYAEPGHHVHAVEVLSLLAVRSLSEDKFGNVHRDVATIIRTFTRVTKKLEAFRENFPVHWTDVGNRKYAPEVDVLLKTLKKGLSEVVQGFESYSRDLRLTRSDIREAKEVSAEAETSAKTERSEEGRDKQPEMTQLGR
ncbi:nuclear envelope protein [Sodiomyces alkalinus F11]|uniref:Nuclear envelope protein n=1 Tax=Sodiomyces alkalinus (strain CBS 110278 / VKM F-3762 / F11) TaxID=1314773 RepID=A0A3N2QA09_SODAK|nr:nuclear envelope protein [Sodiomyces alkalinus F11]ROT43590.1 nuclear envelope protein [Sodiomyces alkalinus F11]